MLNPIQGETGFDWILTRQKAAFLALDNYLMNTIAAENALHNDVFKMRSHYYYVRYRLLTTRASFEIIACGSIFLFFPNIIFFVFLQSRFSAIIITACNVQLNK